VPTFAPDNPLSLIDIKQRVKASILVVTLIAVALPELSTNLLKVFADVAASPVHKSTPQPGTDQSTPIIQSTAGVEALPPAAKDVPNREIGAASEPASWTQTQNSAPSSEALFRQFRAWAAEAPSKAAQALVKPDAPPLVVENAPAPARPTQKHRRAESNARHEPGANVRHQKARVHARPVQNARAQDQYLHLRFSN
jgi:hypothetical protein